MGSQDGVPFDKGSAVTEPSHVVLRVTFHQWGIAAYTVKRGDDTNQFMPVLHRRDKTDSHSWSFIGDLPLYEIRAHNEPMVSSQFCCID